MVFKNRRGLSLAIAFVAASGVPFTACASTFAIWLEPWSVDIDSPTLTTTGGLSTASVIGAFGYNPGPNGLSDLGSANQPIANNVLVPAKAEAYSAGNSSQALQGVDFSRSFELSGASSQLWDVYLDANLIGSNTGTFAGGPNYDATATMHAEVQIAQTNGRILTSGFWTVFGLNASSSGLQQIPIVLPEGTYTVSGFIGSQTTSSYQSQNNGLPTLAQARADAATNGAGFYVGLTANAVPETPAIAVLAIGLGSIGLLRRRNR